MQRGYTLLEMLVVMAILGLLGGLGSVGLQQAHLRAQTHSAIEQLAGLIRLAADLSSAREQTLQVVQTPNHIQIQTPSGQSAAAWQVLWPNNLYTQGLPLEFSYGFGHPQQLTVTGPVGLVHLRVMASGSVQVVWP